MIDQVERQSTADLAHQTHQHQRHPRSWPEAASRLRLAPAASAQSEGHAATPRAGAARVAVAGVEAPGWPPTAPGRRSGLASRRCLIRAGRRGASQQQADRAEEPNTAQRYCNARLLRGGASGDHGGQFGGDLAGKPPRPAGGARQPWAGTRAISEP